jgi:hypothetical protein
MLAALSSGYLKIKSFDPETVALQQLSLESTLRFSIAYSQLRRFSLVGWPLLVGTSLNNQQIKKI